jgi:hypothetical protein
MRRGSRLCCLALLFMMAGGKGIPAPAALHIEALGVARAEQCQYEILALNRELKDLPFPSGWTIAIACTPIAWHESLRNADFPHTDTGFTYIDARTTVLNGAIFHSLQTEYRRTITHELGHIYCKCADEYRANKAAAKLENSKGQQGKKFSGLPAGAMAAN